MNSFPLFPHCIFYQVHLCVIQNKSLWGAEAERGPEQLKVWAPIKFMGLQGQDFQHTHGRSSLLPCHPGLSPILPTRVESSLGVVSWTECHQSKEIIHSCGFRTGLVGRREWECPGTASAALSDSMCFSIWLWRVCFPQTIPFYMSCHQGGSQGA